MKPTQKYLGVQTRFYCYFLLFCLLLADAYYCIKLSFIVQMAGLTFLCHSTKPCAPLTARLRFRYEAQGYNVGNETLRFELKYNVMKSINCLGIYYLKDLIERIDCLKKPLLNAWNNVLFFDPIINKNVQEEKKLLIATPSAHKLR